MLAHLSRLSLDLISPRQFILKGNHIHNIGFQSVKQ